MERMKYFLYYFALIFTSVSLFFWSFTQTDKNLYFFSHPLFVQFQERMWMVSRSTNSWVYILLILLSFALYVFYLREKNASSENKQLRIAVFACCAALLLFSNNALSHDLFNYMFNAKAVLVYGQDPHVRSALEIAPSDEWVRFMHNVHTTAPYGYVWTYLSLVPSMLGFDKFITTFLAFKLSMVLGFFVLLWLQFQVYLQQKKNGIKKNVVFSLIPFALNPLVVIETCMNGHNDVWMMVFAFGSFWLLFQSRKLFSFQSIISLVLLFISIQIKEATLVLVPIWGLLLFWKLEKKTVLHPLLKKCLRFFGENWAELSALALLLPLVTERSQQFNPWYLIWSLTFLPFLSSKMLRYFLLTLSFTSCLRYLPFLLEGGYSDTIQLQMRLITWSAVPIFFLLYFGIQFRSSRKTKNAT